MKIEWDWIGEGLGGDFIDDGKDVRLMRFWVLDEFGEPITDCSYCTLVSRDRITDEELDKVSPIMVQLILDAPSMSNKCQELSWMDENIIRRMLKEN